MTQGEAAVMGEAVREEVIVPEVATDEDVMMVDVPMVVPAVEAGLSVEMVRTMARDAMEELLGIWSDGTGMGYIEPSLAEITWHNYQEMHKLRESSEWWV